MTDETPTGLSPQPMASSPGAAGLVTLLIGVLLAAGGTFWLGPLALVAAALLVVGGLVGAWLVRRQVQAGVTRLLSFTQGLAGQRTVAAAGRPVRLPSTVATGTSALLQPLSEGLSQMLARQDSLFQAQAAQLEALRLQAHSDALTGLPNRRHFMATLDELAEPAS